MPRAAADSRRRRRRGVVPVVVLLLAVFAGRVTAGPYAALATGIARIEKLEQVAV